MQEVYFCYIEALLLTRGSLRRADILATVGVSLPTITRHITAYRNEYPGALEFSPTGKEYFPGRLFTPHTLSKRGITAEQFIAAIKVVFGSAKDKKKTNN